MVEVRKTSSFSDWMARLRDHRARAKIAARIDRLALGNAGMFALSEKVSANCGYTMDPVITFILPSVARR
jgi:putative addiction module killer protein